MLIRFFCAVALIAGAANAQVTNTSYKLANGDRVLRHEIVVDAPVARAWKAFTTAEEMRGFIAPVVAIDLKPLGIWESSYDPAKPIGHEANIQNEVLAFVPERFLAIRVKRTPPGFPHPDVIKQVWTVIWFDDIGGGKTRISTEMLPWKATPENDTLYKFFDSGNAMTLEKAKGYLEKK